MRYQSKWFFSVLALLAVLMVVALTGCSTTNKKTSTLETTATVLPLTPVDTTTQEAPQAPTEVPYVLDGAITTESGLQYLEITAGDGASPKTGDIVKMNYIVALVDGTEIYNTYTIDQPETAVWGQNQLLPGWEEGVNLMKAGGKSKIVIPSELALGVTGAGNVPPNAQLIMEIDLLSVEPAPVPPSVESDELQKMDNGLQYADLVVGDGTEAISGTNVTTDYTIWVQGDPSDYFIGSSKDSQPVTFQVGSGDTVFRGWELGVVGMNVGGKRLLIIPPDLGLGASGSGSIPAYATLVMEITLTEVKEPKKATQVDEEDYITAASGLKYYDIKVGTGITPTNGQTVVVNYVGWLEDGTQFDSSYDRGQPFSFVLGMGNVITGWDLGVSSMKVGGIRQLLIPPDLGYGEGGAGGTIPGGATLIFEVELLEIKP